MACDPAPDGGGGGGDASRLVLLMGWYGCHMRHLSKYCEVLEKIGKSNGKSNRKSPLVITPHVCPGYAVFFPFRVFRIKYARQMLAMVTSFLNEHPNNTWTFYGFSNGAAFVYREIIELLFDKNNTGKYELARRQLKSVIYDSAPCYMHISTGLTAITEGVKSTPLKAIVGALFLLMVPFNVGKPKAFWRALQEDATRCPQLFLFSDVDHLCDAEHIKRLVDTRRKLGVDVTAKNFGQTKHVQHLREAPEEYQAALEKFLL